MYKTGECVGHVQVTTTHCGPHLLMAICPCRGCRFHPRLLLYWQSPLVVAAASTPGYYCTVHVWRQRQSYRVPLRAHLYSATSIKRPADPMTQPETKKPSLPSARCKQHNKGSTLQAKRRAWYYWCLKSQLLKDVKYQWFIEIPCSQKHQRRMCILLSCL
jgi:hypothetical protein